MSHQSDLIAQDILAYLEQHERKEILRFLTCGSVDDGKSTLIGRLLHDSKMIYADQLEAVRSKKPGDDGEFDLALLTDGLQAEREQGITIDVAYRYFSTTKRKFIIADTPGHEQYTRNMATGASGCDVAVILIDARQGVLTQTRRHTFIAALLGIRHVIVAVNKMDLVDFDERVFDAIRSEYIAFTANLGIEDLQFIPISALRGDNVVEKSDEMPWYQGSTLMYLLENVQIASDRNFEDFRFAVQRVSRPDSTFRGYSGTVQSGIIRRGDQIVVLPSGKTSTIARIVTMDGDLEEAFPPLAVTLTLTSEVDISRGDMLVKPGNLPFLEDRFDAQLVWMTEDPLVPGKQYIIKHGTKQLFGRVSAIRHRIDINTLEQMPATTFALNEIGRCEFTLSEPVPFDAYADNRETGAFIVIDRISNRTIGAGMICPPSGDTAKDHWNEMPHGQFLTERHSPVTAAEREQRLGQRAVTVLLTGLSKTGKTAIANAVERRLFDMGRLATVLDGQDFRRGMSRDLGFTASDRSENMRRAAEVAKVVNDAGVICLTAFVVPHEQVRARARDVIGGSRFLEVYLRAPLGVLKSRDKEGMYAAAERGELPSFPGVTSEFEEPIAADLTLDTAELSVEACAERVIDLLQRRGVTR
ncbi:MAG TPA: sulfate adenylyltransferase subunit CysN [Pseudomonadales bacterium]|nr:sulfate adenylyltransferase subunit CysN [Pseudomonadales bacterium]